MQEDLRIGIVLAGGMTKGVYQLGCLRAISEHFGPEQIVAISASSIGVPIGYSFLTGQLDTVEAAWKSIDIKRDGRFFPKYSGNQDILKQVGALVGEGDELSASFYATLWNFSKRNVEYSLFNPLSQQKRREQMVASISIPIFGKKQRLDGATYYDGAFLDNIPVYPLVDADLDVIFCIYFDRRDYLFENSDFDQRIVKLNLFPINSCLMENCFFKPDKVDEMITYGYLYCKEKLEKLVLGKTREEIYRALLHERENHKVEKRLTADTLMTALNRVAKVFAKRIVK